MSVSAIPEGFQSINIYLCCKGAQDAIDFYTRAFGGEEKFRLAGPDGTVMHAELAVGNCTLMLADEHPEMGFSSPHTLGGTAVNIMFYVEDVDAAMARAVEAGAEITRPVEDQFYGDRSGTLKDPFGHTWTLGTHIEDVTPAQIEARMAKMMGG